MNYWFLHLLANGLVENIIGYFPPPDFHAWALLGPPPTLLILNLHST